MSKRSVKHSIRLEPGEAVVVLPGHVWEHIINQYIIVAEDLKKVSPRESQEWQDVADKIDGWLKQTLNDNWDEEDGWQ